MFDTPTTFTEILKENYNTKIRERWNGNFFQKITKSPNLMSICDSKIGSQHHQIAKDLRKNIYQNTPYKHLSVEDLKMFPSLEKQPIIIEEICIKSKASDSDEINTMYKKITDTYTKTNYVGGKHLIVLSHGFEGNSFDLHSLRNNLKYLYPNTIFLCARCNENRTTEEISSMGLRLAIEVEDYIEGALQGKISRFKIFI